MSIGDLKECLRFEKPDSASNGMGGSTGGFEEVFTARAGYTRLRGTETVMAARLTGKQPTVIRIQTHAAARDMQSTWRAIDTRTNELFEIQSFIESDDQRWIDVTAIGYRAE